MPCFLAARWLERKKARGRPRRGRNRSDFHNIERRAEPGSSTSLSQGCSCADRYAPVRKAYACQKVRPFILGILDRSPLSAVGVIYD